MRHKRVTPAVPLTDRLAVTVGEAQILLGGVSQDTNYNLINACLTTTFRFSARVR